MCGLAGYLNLSSNNFKVDEDLLNSMQESLHHRGPDGFGVWKSDKYEIGFAHRRLSIIDLSDAGLQPMLDKDKTVAICFNGEIYNHLNLKKYLQSIGYKYFSSTDTETLMYAYKEWGIDFLDKIDGMFAIALFDLQKNELYLIRDRIGIKPLYFSTQNGILSFASEIKAFWNLPWMKKEINQEALYHYLTFMVSPAPDTIFDQVFKLRAGNYLKVDQNKRIHVCEWYSPIKFLSLSEKKEIKNENFCLEKIEHLLKESIRKRMMSDVPVGAFLSGGVDSSLNVALMSELSTKIKTFTVSFSDGPEFDELNWAKLVANKFNTDHHEIIISEKEAFNFYDDMVYHLDEPLADCVCIPFYYVAKLARDRGVTVAQVGEGADELFFGYSTYVSFLNFYRRYWKVSERIIPNFLKKIIYKFGENVFLIPPRKLEILKNWADGRDFFWSGAIAFTENEKKKIFEKNNFDSYSFVKFCIEKLKKNHLNIDFINQMMYLELNHRLPELLLMRADKMSMASGVEARVPFLDYKIVEFMLQVPGCLKFKNGQTKYLLKKVAEKYLPKEVVYRKKIGFAAPIVRWFDKGKYFPAYFERLTQNGGRKQNLFFKQPLDNAVQKWTVQNFLTLIN